MTCTSTCGACAGSRTPFDHAGRPPLRRQHFYPETGTLALSDAMLVEGMPARRSCGWDETGTRPQPAASARWPGRRGDVRARALSHGQPCRGRIAGIVFAFAPYRFEHAMHMELQWAMWMPLAFLALHRTFERGSGIRARHGRVSRAADAVQHLLRHLPREPHGARGRPADGPRSRGAARARPGAVAGGAALAAIVSALYGIPYLRVHDRVGDRWTSRLPPSARGASSYLAATPTNWLYGGASVRRSASTRRRAVPGGDSRAAGRRPACCCARRRAARSSTCCCWSPRSRPRLASVAMPTASFTITCRRFASFARRRGSGSAC